MKASASGCSWLIDLDSLQAAAKAIDLALRLCLSEHWPPVIPSHRDPHKIDDRKSYERASPMFGFGRPANEKTAINVFTQQLSFVGADASAAATKLVDEVLTNLRLGGMDPFKVTQGNDFLLKPDFVAPRSAAGLTERDIRTYWNRPLVVVFGEEKVTQMLNFLYVNVAEQRGQDVQAAAMTYKRLFARYGDPTKWNPADPYNTGLREIDADIYPEFSERVNKWRTVNGDAGAEQLVAKHGTFNAGIRALLVQGKLP